MIGVAVRMIRRDWTRIVNFKTKNDVTRQLLLATLVTLNTVSQAYFALHETLHQVQNF
jgi:hypothetical protein